MPRRSFMYIFQNTKPSWNDVKGNISNKAQSPDLRIFPPSNKQDDMIWLTHYTTSCNFLSNKQIILFSTFSKPLEMWLSLIPERNINSGNYVAIWLETCRNTITIASLTSPTASFLVNLSKSKTWKTTVLLSTSFGGI